LREIPEDIREAVAFFLGMDSYVYGYPLVTMEVTRDVQCFSAFDRRSQPAWLEATACPGLRWVLGVAVVGSHRPQPTASSKLDGLVAATESSQL
jgi:hypothetical protein